METPQRRAGTYLLFAVVVILVGWIAYLTGRLQTLEGRVRDMTSSPAGAGGSASLAGPDQESLSPVVALGPGPASGHAQPRPAAPQDLAGESAATTTNATDGAARLTLVAVRRDPFPFLFSDYAWDPETRTGYNFQINPRAEHRTLFIRQAGDPIPDTGYAITKFEQKLDTADHSVNSDRRDISELTVRRTGEEPVLLVLRVQHPGTDLRADIACGPNGQPQPAKRGQEFACGGHTYRVLELNPTTAVVQDTATSEKRTLALAAHP